MAAAINSFDTPKILRPSNSVRSTTTRSGTRNIRTSVNEFGRFTAVRRILTHPEAFDEWHNITDCHEGDPSRGRQRDAPQTAHHSHAQADRPYFQSALSQ